MFSGWETAFAGGYPGGGGLITVGQFIRVTAAGRETVCGWGENCPWRCCTAFAGIVCAGQPQWRGVRNQFSPPSAVLSSRAVAIPHCDAIGNDALDGAAVKVHQNLGRQMDLPQSPQEEEMLVSFLDQGWGVEGPREIHRDVDTQKLKAGDTLTSIPLIRMGACVPPFVFLKCTMSSSVFLVLRARLLSAHPATRCWTSSL